MNRIFTLMLILPVFFIQSLSGQPAHKTSFVEGANSFSPLKKNKQILPGNAKSTMAPPFFTQDFSSGIPGTWTNFDNAGSGVIWVVTTTGSYNTGLPVDEQLSNSGTSALNGYLKLDSDSAGLGISENASLTTTAINCSGHSTVHLSFAEYFAQYGLSTGIVSVSNNNVTWTDVYHAETGLTQDSSTSNPHFVDVDISSVAANQPAVYIRYTYVGSYDYWWFVDDVELYEPSAVDLAAISIERLNDEYTRIPRLQATTLTLSANIKNMGTNTTSGGVALFEVLDASTLAQVYSQNVNLTTITSGAVQNVSANATFTPPYAGFFKSKVTINVTSDGNTLNNSIESLPIEISDSVYSRDDGILESILGVGAGPNENGAAGQNFQINNTDYLTSITFFLKDTFTFDPGGTPIYFTIHSQPNDTSPPNGLVSLGITDTLLLFPGSIPAGGAYYTLPIHGSPLLLAPGLYFVAFHEVNLILPMGYSLNNFKNGAIWVHWNSIPSPPAIGGWAKAEDFGFYVSYMIRANLGLSTGISDNPNNNDISIYPNPAKDFFTVKLKKNMSGSVEICNVLGDKVAEKTFINKSVIYINTQNLANGIYHIRVLCDGETAAGKLLISGK